MLAGVLEVLLGAGEAKCRFTSFDRQDEKELSSRSGAVGGSEHCNTCGCVRGDGVRGVGPIRSLSETGGRESWSSEFCERVRSESWGGMVPRTSELGAASDWLPFEVPASASTAITSGGLEGEVMAFGLFGDWQTSSSSSSSQCASDANAFDVGFGSV